MFPAASTLPPLACADSTLPIPASSGQVMWQFGFARARSVATFWYAASTVPGMPDASPLIPGIGGTVPSVVPVTGTSIVDFSWVGRLPSTPG